MGDSVGNGGRERGLAERVAGRWVLPDSAGEFVERRLVGRPWSEAACWGVLCHVSSTRRPFENDERVALALVVALDLAESADQRTEGAGRALLDRETETVAAMLMGDI